MRIKTILLAVGLTWIAPLAHAQRPGSAPAVSNRPSLMPCRIVERIEGAPQIEKLYTLHYRRDGRLDRATQQTVLNRCVTVKECRFGDEDPVLEYQYDDEGRLISVKLLEPAQVVSIKYLMGRLQEYERTANPHDDVFGESRTVVSPDAAGRPTASMERTEGRRRMRTTARFSNVQEPFASEPVVWPYSPRSLYFGWTRRTATVSVTGVRDSVFETETVSFDEKGRIRKAVLVVDYQGRTSVSREFIYDCPDQAR
jgi:hypothetical protein